MKPLIIIAILVTTGGVFAEPLNPDCVSEKAVWLAHLDLDLIKDPESGLGRWFVEQSYKPDAVRKLNAAQSALGIDVRNDISSLTAYGLSIGESNVVAMISGVFDSLRLKTLVNGLENYSVTTNEGCEIHSWNKDDNPIEQHYASFQGTNRVVFASDKNTLTHAMKVLMGKSEGGRNSTLLKIAEGKNMLAAAFQSDRPLEWPQAGMLKNADAGVFTIGESDEKVNVKLMLNAVDSVQADNLSKIVEGLRAMAMLSSDSKPEAAKVARNITVDKHENAVSLTFSSALPEVIKVLEESTAKNSKQTRKRKPFK